MDGRKEIEKMIEECTLIIDGKIENLNILDAYCKRGIAYNFLGQYEKSLEDFNYLINKVENNERHYFYRAVAYYKLNNYDNAIEDINKTIKINKEFKNAHLIRGLIYSANNDYEKAIADFNYAIENGEDSAVAYQKRGFAYKSLKKYDKAITDYDKAITDYDKAIEKNISLNNINPETYYERGVVLYYLKQYDKAIEDFNFFIKNSDNNAYGFLSRGAIYYELKKNDKAIEDFDQAIEEFKKKNIIEPKVYYNRGILLNDLGQYDKAIEDFSYSIENSEDNANGYLSRGDAYQALGEFLKAIDDYNKAISLNIQNPNVYFNRGLIYYKSKEDEKAIADFKDCIKMKPNFYEAHFNIGHIYYIQDKYKESAEFFNDAKKDPLFVLSYLKKINDLFKKGGIKNVISEMIDLDGTNFFNRTTSSLNHTEKQACKDIYIIMLELISILHINNKNESTFSHYTKRSTASQLIFKSSPFRLNSTITCNDPEEGKTLLKYLGKNEIDNPKKEHNYQAFIGCFTFNRESLNQFRLYGKEDNKEATGVSLEIKKEFFDEEVGVSILDQICQPDTSQLLESESNLVEKTDKEENNKKDKEEKKKYALYRCIYIDPEIKRAISVGHKEEYAFYKEKGNCSEETIKEYKKYKEDIAKVIEHVNLKLEELCEDIEIAKGEKNENSPIICELLLPLRYLVKHVAFKEEQECRIFDVKDLKEDKIKNKEIHFTDDFMQMYIEYQPIKKEELEGVVFAPKAENIDVFIEALRQNDFKIKCERSTLPFA